MNMDAQLSLQDNAFNYFGYAPRSGTGGSYSSSIFNFLRNFQTALHSVSSSEKCLFKSFEYFLIRLSVLFVDF